MDAGDTTLAATAARTRQRLARSTLAAFVMTFVVSRVLVYLIMSRRVPDLYLYFGHTHVHHLNYGIVLLSVLCGVLLFGPRTEPQLRRAAIGYGVGLALTFDEFGMWLHLGGAYWQRLSFDAVAVVGTLLALIALAPPMADLGTKERVTAVLLVLASVVFVVAMVDVVNRSNVTARLEAVERQAPP